MKQLWALGVFLLLSAATVAAQAAAGTWEAADKVFGAAGKDLPGDVHRYGWPRSDLNVTIGDVAVAPGLALGSWAGFHKTGMGNEAMTMGDLVVVAAEVQPVVDALHAGGFEVLAIHNHLLGETPPIAYSHLHGVGEQASLAKTLKAALAKTRTPAPGSAPGQPTPEQAKTFEKLQEALGRKGTMSGAILQVAVARADAIREGGMEVPASMGMNNPMNFQAVGNRVATTGDFVLVAGEVGPVMKELRSHGIAVTALHSHMLREEPRLFLMHFWGVDSPEKIGEGLKAALSKVATK